MIIKIIIIYLILLCLYSYEKIKKNIDLMVYNKGQFLLQIFYIFVFFIFYILGLRILNLFRTNKLLDLNSIGFNIVLIFFLIFVFRKLVFYFFKVSWFKFHYVMMCGTNFSTKITFLYKKLYYNAFYLPAYYTYKYLIYINYLMGLLLIIFLVNDLVLNSLVLNLSLWYLKYYSIFRLFFFSYKFAITKQNLVLDYYNYNLMYPGNSEKNFFLSFCDSSHHLMMEESQKYSYGIILEKIEYQKIDIGNTAEMPYFLTGKVKKL